MDCEEARKIRKDSDASRVRIQRFAYDVFSCMLPLCGLPEATISNTNIEVNDYSDKEFVKKSALSVLPLAMFVRDDWKRVFELRHYITGFNSLEMIQDYIISNLTRNADFKNADDATKVRVSLAYFSEITLFLHYKGLETYVDKLPEFWCDFYLEHITTNLDIEGLFASSFFMFPEATESPEWTTDFVKEFAVPYGSSSNVSHMFSVYSIASTDSKSSPLKEMSTMNNKTNNSGDMPDTPADGASNVAMNNKTNNSGDIPDTPADGVSNVAMNNKINNSGDMPDTPADGVSNVAMNNKTNNSGDMPDTPADGVSNVAMNNKTNNSGDMPDTPADGASNVANKRSAPSMLENTNLSPILPRNHVFFDSSESPESFKSITSLDAPEKQSTRVLKLNPPKKLRIDEAFGQMSLDSEELALRETIHENAGKKEDK